ncbi:MAG TPA: HD domain-containing phosphohydrolase [Pirellulales bacterium]|jgi:putative two-component system response regulator|nr:HD domain-containing phosphohydrolase [Pirellulales bacterium]
MHGLSQDSNARVLVVDDEPAVRDLLSRWLRDAGYLCATAPNAAAAWTHLGQHPVDLATLDITMPGGSGLDLLDQIRQELPDTAALMLTAEGDTTKAIRALTAGANGYLIKPIERQELLIQVRNALERRRLVIENRQYTRELESKVREQTLAIRLAHEESIHRLVKASLYRDEETGAHIRRTGRYSELLAATLGWDRERVESIRLAAPMHDIGKIAIPDAILCKPGKLTPDEFAAMQTHAELGARLLAGSQSPVLRMAHEIALGHHERWDGSGYPSGLRGTEIPESARIVAIVDVYDALSHDRVYRPALPEAEVLKILHSGRGTHFDPRLLDAFLALLPEMRAIAESVTDCEADENELKALQLPIADLTLIPAPVTA